MDLLAELTSILGAAHVLTGPDTAPYATDWTGKYTSAPLAVLRPANTAQVSAVMRVAHETGTPVVTVSGNTGLAGGTFADGVLMLSIERMNRIEEIRPDARIAIVGAGVILSQMHDAAAEHGLAFPVTFGARGSARIGGILSTNAGGSNVLRYGNTRALCLGVEAVLADGRVLNLMTELHKDNTGYDLRDLLIGSEGTLAVITRAVLKLVEAPRAHVTAMVAVPALSDALVLLNRLQAETGGAVQAFEFMPDSYIRQHMARFPDARAPFDESHAVNVLMEVGATAPRDTTPEADGSIPIVTQMENTLAAVMEDGRVLDAVVATSESQRAEMWARREAAAEVGMGRKPAIVTDVAVPLDRVATFLDRMNGELAGMDAGAEVNVVSHLGDGNVHYVVWPTSQDPDAHDAIVERVEDVVLSLGGSFSAEHGVGLSKKPSMARRKDAVALDVMRAIKAALDPRGILNPGKLLP